MRAQEELWIPLVDEPIGSIVKQIQEEHPEIDELVVGARRTLAFRTFAYIRVGMLLGQLLVDQDVVDGRDWISELLADPRNRDAVVAEVLAVAREIGQGDAEAPLVPDEGVRERFLDFARKLR
ncbi:MAG TPA: hypothetical protein VFW85_08560 [Gaiellaceae bacterium]|nr:hypothetical protein [Gaiellaceae bacterium]